MIKTIANVKGLGKIVKVCSNLYNELQELKQARAGLISPRDEAYARIQTKGKENIGKSYGTWTSAGLEYMKREFPLLNLQSRLLNPQLAKAAVEVNRAERYFSTNDTKAYETSFKQAEKDKNKKPSERKVIILPSRNNFEMAPKKNWETAQGLLQDQAEEYFELNNEFPMAMYLVEPEIVDKQKGTMLIQLWFRNLDNRSGFDGYNRGLDGDCRARGVRAA